MIYRYVYVCMCTERERESKWEKICKQLVNLDKGYTEVLCTVFATFLKV